MRIKFVASSKISKGVFKQWFKFWLTSAVLFFSRVNVYVLSSQDENKFYSMFLFINIKVQT